MKGWTTFPVSVRHRNPGEIGAGKMDWLLGSAQHEVSAEDVVDDVDKQLHIIPRFNKMAKLIKELNMMIRVLQNSKSFLIPRFIKGRRIGTSSILRTIFESGRKHILPISLHLACKKGNIVNNNKVRVCVI